ncbi:hypothetical protein [Candidatus Avelusimicrobium facis]|uniref:hypothetical protein n=1 Tax=Candidatus Avelusimicrobium facis TaxID=3416203 RepID=UPI003D11FE70
MPFGLQKRHKVCPGGGFSSGEKNSGQKVAGCVPAFLPGRKVGKKTLFMSFSPGQKKTNRPRGPAEHKKENFFGPPFTHRFIAAQTKGRFLNEILFFIDAPMAAA